jgi:guanosine-3',5'-bis(diphosphate) 3'-pyrophosphohydrolase
MNALAKDPDRLIEVAWEESYSAAHPVEIQLTALDRAGLLADVVSIIADAHMNMLSTTSRAQRNRTAIIDLIVEVKDAKQLDFILHKMRTVRDVMTVERVTHERRFKATNN